MNSGTPSARAASRRDQTPRRSRLPAGVVGPTCSPTTTTRWRCRRAPAAVRRGPSARRPRRGWRGRRARARSASCSWAPGDRSRRAHHRSGLGANPPKRATASAILCEGGDQIAHVLGVERAAAASVDHVRTRIVVVGSAMPRGPQTMFISTPRAFTSLSGSRPTTPQSTTVRLSAPAISWTVRRSARRLCAAQLRDERPGCRIGLGVQLVPEQRDEVFVVPERFGLASRGGERLHDQPMGVLAHVVERDGASAGLQSVFGTTGGEFQFAEPHHGTKGEFSSRARHRQPFAQPSSLTAMSSISRRGRDRLPRSTPPGRPRGSAPRTG